jgi:hypothetical protein
LCQPAIDLSIFMSYCLHVCLEVKGCLADSREMLI